VAHDAVRATGRRDGARLVDQRQRVVAASLAGGNVGQADQVRGHAWHEPDLPAKPHRLLQPLARGVQPADGVLRNALVPQRIGHCLLVPGPLRELAGSLQGGSRHVVIVPDNLMEAADPEQRLSLAGQVAEHPVQLRRALEQRQLPWVLPHLTGIGVPLLQEARVDDPAAGQGQVSFHGIQLPVCCRQRVGVATEDGTLVQQPGSLDPVLRAHRCLACVHRGDRELAVTLSMPITVATVGSGRG
jgi:hypothetical protein